MGAEQSQPEKPTNPVRIDRSEIPEAYLNVAVSDTVVKRARSGHNDVIVDDEAKQRLEEQLQREREANQKLRKQMQELSELQQRLPSNVEVKAPSPKIEPISLDYMQERNQVFDDTVDRVKKQFFSFQRENICDGTEKAILTCLAKNNGQHLKCSTLLPKYHDCIEKFKEEVLAQKKEER